MIKYLYALDDTDCVIHITNLNNENRRNSNYKCLSCGDQLIPRLGEVKRHHFAHKSENTCSYESYLHKLAKNYFVYEYKKCLENNLPFYLEYEEESICNFCEKDFDRSCLINKTIKKHDLTTTHKEIYLEQKIGEFRPDIVLKGKTPSQDIFIEIAVTHRADQDKINSGYRIAEISISHEDELDFIDDHILYLDSEKITYYNFKVCKVKTPIYNLKKNCDYFFHYIIKLQNEKIIYGCAKYKNILRELSIYKSVKTYLIYNKIFNSKEVYPSIILELLNNLASSGENASHCLLCKNAHKTKYRSYWCEKSGRAIYGFDANECKLYNKT